ncbi:MAG TPA: hypothetical protein VGM34_02015, partial [Chlamydiales bacterium]
MSAALVTTATAKAVITTDSQSTSVVPKEPKFSHFQELIMDILTTLSTGMSAASAAAPAGSGGSGGASASSATASAASQFPNFPGELCRIMTQYCGSLTSEEDVSQIYHSQFVKNIGLARLSKLRVVTGITLEVDEHLPWVMDESFPSVSAKGMPE